MSIIFLRLEGYAGPILLIKTVEAEEDASTFHVFPYFIFTVSHWPRTYSKGGEVHFVHSKAMAKVWMYNATIGEGEVKN